jgi:SAM-dependent methyltransferase
MLSPSEWHRRFTQQSRWTAQVRRALLDGLNLKSSRSALEVGCGTGVIASDILRLSPRTRVNGIDLRLDFLQLAHRENPALALSTANGLALPFADSTFDFTFCHYLLLWIPDPAALLREMARVTRPGGAVLALAEPDYGGRIDYPAELGEIGQQQAASLRNQGANPNTGRQLMVLFKAAGLQNVRCAVLGGQWGEAMAAEEVEAEWRVLAADLGGSVAPGELETYRRLDAEAWGNGERVLYVPTFYGWGFRR